MARQYSARFVIVTQACLSLAILLPPWVIAQQSDHSSTTVVLRKSNGESYALKSSLTIGEKTTITQDGESLAVLLRRNGIQFNASAASIFYSLNPKVSDFADLSQGVQVNVPYPKGGAEVQDALNSGFLVYISADSSLKAKIAVDVEHLGDIMPSLARLNIGVFGSIDKKSALINASQQATDHLRDIKTLLQEDIQPFTAEALRQYRDDADILLSVVQNILDTGRVSDKEVKTIFLIAKDLSTKARGINGSKSPGNVGRDPQATMIVTLLPAASSRATSLRVCYSVEALFTRRKQCSTTLGSHAKWTLPVADYLVWAAVDESSPPVVKPRPVPLEREGEAVQVELRLPDEI